MMDGLPGRNLRSMFRSRVPRGDEPAPARVGPSQLGWDEDVVVVVSRSGWSNAERRPRLPRSELVRRLGANALTLRHWRQGPRPHAL